MTSYNPSIPNPPNDPSVDVITMQTNAAAISNLVVVDHIGFNVVQAGQHKQITFAGNNLPVVPTSPPVLFTSNDAFGLPQLYFFTGNVTQSSGQYVALANGSVMLMGGLILKWGQIVINANPTPISFIPAFPHNCFSITATARQVGPNVGFYAIDSFTAAGFQIRSAGTATLPQNAFYMAIGN